ncbi:glycosyltransferase family 2 protein [Bifidobacterium minimum]|uniref:glycosyltransferase family 2 protein n=1 Tax=Bifidobacterium minimum TaxID=1693 RepID=UPI00138AB8F5|nr:glycosyltransferase family 2 protein [Bifidobacterium minimum]
MTVERESSKRRLSEKPADRSSATGEDPRDGGPIVVPGPDSLVSIIVPVYGVQEYLDAALAGVVGQTHSNLEIILVDDGSPDECPRICDEWARRDARITVIHEENGGLSKARNTGLSAAHGDAVYFMDSDDLVEPTLVARCLEAMADHGADMAMFRFDTIDDSGAPMKSSYRHNEYDGTIELTPEQALRLQVKGDIDSYFWAFMVARRVYVDQDFSFPEGRYIEDMARICHVIGESSHVVRIPDVLYHYRLRAGSVAHTPSASLMADWMQAAHDRREYIVTRHPGLRRFVAVQTMNVLGNLNMETFRQSIVFGLKLDPQSQQQFRDRVTEFLDDLGYGQDDGVFAELDDDESDEDRATVAETRAKFTALVDSASDSLRDMKDAARDSVSGAKDSVKDGIREGVDKLREVFDLQSGEDGEKSEKGEGSSRRRTPSVRRSARRASASR